MVSRQTCATPDVANKQNCSVGRQSDGHRKYNFTRQLMLNVTLCCVTEARRPVEINMMAELEQASGQCQDRVPGHGVRQWEHDRGSFHSYQPSATLLPPFLCCNKNFETTKQLVRAWW